MIEEKSLTARDQKDMWLKTTELEKRGYECIFPSTLFREPTYDGGIREVYRAKMRKKVKGD